MKPIRLAIIGCGGFVRYHVKRINGVEASVPEFKLAALCDIVREKAVKLRKEHFAGQKIAIFEDYREMLATAKPDAVIVSTPHTLHFRHAYDSIAAGAHVMVDKPMVTNSTHARRLVAKAAKEGKRLHVAIQGTHTDTFAYARKLLTDGTMGELQLVTAVLAQGWRDATVGLWRQVPKLSGGGQMYDSGAHVFSALMFLVNSPVTAVHCWADNKGTAVDINAVCNIKFANGAMANVTSGGNCATFLTRMMFQGKNAWMEISPHGGGFRVKGDKVPEITAAPADWSVPTVTPARNFADSILGRSEPRCGGDVGIMLADLMDALYESVRTGKVAHVKPKK
jgi:predicted dehydrogenase